VSYAQKIFGPLDGGDWGAQMRLHDRAWAPWWGRRVPDAFPPRSHLTWCDDGPRRRALLMVWGGDGLGLWVGVGVFLADLVLT